MKYIFTMLNKGKLWMIGALPMVISMACKRNAPRYEPDPIDDQVEKSKIDLTITQGQNKKVDHMVQDRNYPYKDELFMDNLPEYYKSSPNVAEMLKHIAPFSGKIFYSERCSAGAKLMAEKETSIFYVYPRLHQPLQNDFSAWIQASQGVVSSGGENTTSIIHLDGQEPKRIVFNKLPDKLCIAFVRAWQKERWDERDLTGTECIIIKHDPALPHSEKSSFALAAFLVDVPLNDNQGHHLVAFVKSDQQWWYYCNNDAKVPVSNEKAIYASRQGTLFFYDKSA